MKRKIRILRIWFYGKLPLAKKIKAWNDSAMQRFWVERFGMTYSQFIAKYTPEENSLNFFTKE